ncbi:MAG: phospho-N-acetylmuramoyl-pentapeptide-transferase [Armatimonadota bacterium]|nr:phospho-N-acetylmuramoyl-pentapeptide-transferase [Armatimonadota bacterium]MDR7451749.1 phospho-N-acetylmuramoyl-pentapeptide-transferase [Armatimonadota bacterium]MDR7467374.1 phospho-N-acetylmuramoyl-pentapeptide-transferase [Armatimonadota bacterium]MDR7494144.1 phospho-N-acetylmuramoyl-pentapeptide-transferase [Armatimonadota bacterium]MDR7498890.1 phospho-N-acetylmuramoyl-pentapeptide-transferase [Armatimonadota bacterium]
MTPSPALAATLAAVMTTALGYWAIPRLRMLHVRQAIREEAPVRHRAKAGTPTMGGTFIIAAIVAATLLTLGRLSPGPAFALLVTAGYGLVGGLDDLLKVRRRRNIGLRARERLALQLFLAAPVALYVARRPDLGTALSLPGLGSWDLGWGYVVFAVLYIVGFANAVNLTDGLDGLAAGTVAIAAAAYAAVALHVGRPELSALAAAVAGSCLGFLWFNAHPAQVIMGDVGSNALGAVLALLAILTKTELLLFLVGLVFVLEAASDILQVAYFKSTGGKRIFRMAPLHHHFELSGWTETQTVTRLWLMALFAALAGLAVLA